MIRFRDLSIPLKIAVISSYLVGTWYLLMFIIGFILGVVMP